MIFLCAISVFVMAEHRVSHYPHAKGNFFQMFFGVPSTVKSCNCSKSNADMNKSVKRKVVVKLKICNGFQNVGYRIDGIDFLVAQM